MTATSRAPRLAALTALLLALPFPLATARAAVILELFTAQGCSSCPPADRLLTAIGADADLGKRVVPLAFHVDYWDTPAWRDRFSDKAWSRRQADYVHAAGQTEVYTPQAIVDGARACVGSDVRCLHEAVDAASARDHGAVEITAAPPKGDAVEVTVDARLPTGVARADVMVAVWEMDLDTEVSGGENAHKTLHDDYVVRRLEKAFTVSQADAVHRTVRLALDPQWKRDRLGVAVFLQDPRSKRAMGAAAAPLPPAR